MKLAMRSNISLLFLVSLRLVAYWESASYRLDEQAQQRGEARLCLTRHRWTERVNENRETFVQWP
jgi:hypothetical protein